MPQPNVLLVTFDDLGIYEVTPTLMPNYTAFVGAGGARAYTRCYSMPVCSQSRACMLFGKYGRTLGIIGPMSTQNGPEPSISTDTLAGLLQFEGYHTCLIGKWHLGRNAMDVGLGYLGAPESRGFDWWLAGTPDNPESYTNWTRVDGDEITQETAYLTTEQVATATAWWGATSGPKFMQVSMSAPHGPYHFPPSDLLGGFVSTAVTQNRKKYESMVRSADWAFGQILAAVGPDTVVVATADNGSPPNAHPDLPHHDWKGTTYEGGIRVPLAIRSQFGGGTSDRLVHLVDLPGSILSLVGADIPADWDSSSLYTPARETCISEAFANSTGELWSAAMTKRYKLVRPHVGPEELYDLNLDQYEQLPLDKDDPFYASTLATLRAALS